MRRAQLTELTKRLDRIIALLEMQTIVPDDALPICEHQNALDLGAMGDMPGQKMYCRDCGQNFSRGGKQ